MALCNAPPALICIPSPRSAGPDRSAIAESGRAREPSRAHRRRSPPPRRTAPAGDRPRARSAGPAPAAPSLRPRDHPLHHPRTSSHRIESRSLARGSSSTCRTIRYRPFQSIRWSRPMPSRRRIVTRYLGIALSAWPSLCAPTLSSATLAQAIAHRLPAGLLKSHRIARRDRPLDLHALAQRPRELAHRRPRLEWMGRRIKESSSGDRAATARSPPPAARHLRRRGS